METKILNTSEFQNLIYGGKNLPLQHYLNDLDKIDYFSFDDFRGYFFGSEKYNQTCRYVVSYDKKHIYGILKFAYFSGCGGKYSISYCSTNSDYKGNGICKNIVKIFMEYFSLTYPNDILHTSQYTVSGWKYLRKAILENITNLNIKFEDNIVGYFDKGKKYDEEFYYLHDLSQKLLKK